MAHLVTLGLAQEREQIRLALNTYCRPFLVLARLLGIWCPEGRNLRLACFDPDQLKDVRFGRSCRVVQAILGPYLCRHSSGSGFRNSARVAIRDAQNRNPARPATVDELIVPTSYKAMSDDDPAFALFVFYLQAGLLEVLPQKWFTAAQYRVGQQWITRAVRDPETQRIVGECFGVGTFLLEEDGCRLAEWISRR